MHTLKQKQLPLPLPDTTDPKELATTFNTFYDEIIKKIMEILCLAHPSDIDGKYTESHPITKHSLIHFNSLNLMELKDIIHSSGTKSCELDALPTSLVKSHLDTLLPVFHGNYKMYLSPQEPSQIV